MKKVCYSLFILRCIINLIALLVKFFLNAAMIFIHVNAELLRANTGGRKENMHKIQDKTNQRSNILCPHTEEVI